MTFYLVAGCGAPTTPAVSDDHLPSKRARRYPSDTTDAEWQLIGPFIPTGQPDQRGGTTTNTSTPRHHRRNPLPGPQRLRLASPPADFPPWKTVYDYHAHWTADGTVNHLHNTLRDQVRHAAGRDREPTAATIDSQSVRAAETVARTSRGYDAGKKVNGRKRHIAVDTIGLLLVVAVSAASVQDRHAGRTLWRCGVAG